MFAGGRRRTSNIRVMQLFHELKQQFPAVPDHVVSACIANYASNREENENFDLREVLEAVAALHPADDDPEQPMGRTLAKPSALSAEEPQLQTSPDDPLSERRRSDMHESESDVNRNVVKPSAFYSKESQSVSVNTKLPERPNHLDIRQPQDGGGFNRIQPSERCFDLQKLLNAENLNVKPPRSPLSAKRFATAKNSPTIVRSPLASPDTPRRIHHGSTESVSASTSGVSSGVSSGSANFPRRPETTDKRPETADTPTQTTETLLGGVNLSLNVNCQMDLVQSPTVPKHTSVLQVTPHLPWCQEPLSQRSYTSVNLTLRPPSSEPQAPIDITSQNSSLTYSTSSFDSQKGLQSRLQITVGPGGGSVASVRTRPRSSYHPQDNPEQTVPVRAGSLPDLATETKSPVICKQQARIERLRIELISEKGRLIAMQEEVATLEKPNALASKVEAEIEKQLQKEIRHLRGQCERLTYDVDRQTKSRVPLGETNEEFYRNIYTGQRGSFTFGSSEQRSQTRHVHHQGPPPQSEAEGPKWNCHLCTFQNHPLLDKCEQCEMPRILHGTKAEPPNPCLAFGMVRPLGDSGPYSPNQVFTRQEAAPNPINPLGEAVLPFNRLLTRQSPLGGDATGASFRC